MGLRVNIGGAMALLLLAAGAGCTGRVQGAHEGPPPAFPVKTLVAQAANVGESTEYLATLRSRSSAILQPQVEGNVTRVLVRSGDYVEPGAPLLEIDPLKQQATVNNQEATHRARLANLEWTRTDLERKKALFAAGVISRQDLDQSQAAYDSAKAEVEAMEAGVREQQVQLHYYTVKAPAAGVIGDLAVRVGDRVRTDTTLTTLDKGGELEVYISIPPEKASQVRLGTAVQVLGEDGRPATNSAISFVSPRVDPASQLLLVKALLPNQDHGYRHEQIVHVRVIWSQAQRPMLPVTAVARITGQTFAYVVEENGNQSIARQRQVRLGEIVGNDYVVLDGIKPGERMIVDGVQMLVDGMPVQPQS
jgi:RND family efflux transporter MFP subunit